MKKTFHALSLTPIVFSRPVIIAGIIVAGAFLSVPLFAQAVTLQNGALCQSSPQCDSKFCDWNDPTYLPDGGTCRPNPNNPTPQSGSGGGIIGAECIGLGGQCTSEYCKDVGCNSGYCGNNKSKSTYATCIADPNQATQQVDPSSVNNTSTQNTPSNNSTVENTPTNNSPIENTPTNTGSAIKNPLKVSTLDGFLVAILGFVKTLGGIFVVLMLVYTGFKFVTAQGNPEKLSEARNSLFWTVLGALVLLGATVIAAGIKATVESITV